MKIFISWSGDSSRQVATLLRDWLRDIFPDVVPFVSSEDLRKGKLWRVGLAKELSETNFGISCLTPTNLESSWLIYEAGALSKILEEGQVCTLLLGGLKYTDITGPLEKFQHTNFEHQDVRRLVGDINERLLEGKRTKESLDRVYEKFWPDLQLGVASIVNQTGTTDHIVRRSAEDLLIEILERTRSIESQLPLLQPYDDDAFELPKDYAADDPYVDFNPTYAGDIWLKSIEVIKRQRPLLTAWLQIGRPLAIVRGYFVVYFNKDQSMSVQSLRKRKTSEFLSGVLTDQAERPLSFLALAEEPTSLF